MESQDPDETALESTQPTAGTGPFVLRALLEDLPLSADGDRDDIEINCVEFLGTQTSFLFLLLYLTLSRAESLRGNICFRSPPFCTNTSRP